MQTLISRLTLCSALLFTPVLAFAADDAALPPVHMFKSDGCECCDKWADHLRTNGFTVSVQSEPDMTTIKRNLGVNEALESCHTAKIGDYVIEGHVPAADIKRLLGEKPEVVGLTAPGMPMSSPGMDMPGEAYDVLSFSKDGKTEVFAHHDGK